MNHWDWHFVWRTLPQLVDALCVTLQATALGMLLAATLGLFWAVARRSAARLVSWPAAAVVEFIRSTPLLVQLYFLYYVFPSLGVTLSAMAAGVIGLGVHYSSYTAEVYRAGLEGVPRGQWEAATALNLSKWDTLRRVVLPQAIPPVLPALGNYLVAMFKETPLLSAITVVELVHVAKDEIGAETFKYLEPLTLVGVIFLVLSLLSAAMIRYVEAKWTLRRIAV